MKSNTVSCSQPRKNEWRRRMAALFTAAALMLTTGSGIAAEALTMTEDNAPQVSAENIEQPEIAQSAEETADEPSNDVMALSEVAQYTPVDSMGIAVYYCEYDPNSTATKINDYYREQINPATDEEKYNGHVNRFAVNNAFKDDENYYVPLSFFEEIYSRKKEVEFKSDDDTCRLFYNKNSSSYSKENLVQADYVNINDIRYVKIKALTPDADTSHIVGYITYFNLKKATDTFNTPLSSTVVNMFDYWTSDNPEDRFADDNYPSTEAELNSGINNSHELKFGKGITDYGTMNYSKGGTTYPSEVTQGIVANKLGDDSYPKLSGNTDLMRSGVADEAANESLRYLFDPTYDQLGKKSFSNVTGILRENESGYYYYDAKERAVELDETPSNGYYTVNEYTSPAVGYNTTIGQFFPFNSAHKTAHLKADEKPINHYFGVSISARFVQQNGGIVAESVNKTPVTFEFKGDNDVWIFIDGVLVGDLGGLRSAADIIIDFSTGEVKIEDGTPDNKNTTIKAAFENVGLAGNEDMWKGNTFADGTYHTMKFFYLERGNYDSNLKLQYNLTEVPPSGIYKVNQYGDEVDGARFAVYSTDEEYKYKGKGRNYTSEEVANFSIDSETGDISNGENVVIEPVYCGVTENGEMVFKDSDGLPYSMEELEEKFGKHFILREVDIPLGYRTVKDEIQLSIDGGVIMCEDTYESGVWASSSVMVTATNTLYATVENNEVISKMAINNDDINQSKVMEAVKPGTSGEMIEVPIYSINYYSPGEEPNGTLFSVVLKRNERDFWHGYGYDYWYPVYGTDATGYEIVTDGVPDEPTNWDEISVYNAGNNVKAAITAAQKQADLAGELGEAPPVFIETGSGMQLTFDDMPGSIDQYYSWMLSNGKLADTSVYGPEYVVAYYWTSADSVYGADETNTVRVYSHKSVLNGIDGMRLQWGTTVEVPNMENRLYFQKLSGSSDNMTTDPTFVENAVFALYNITEEKVSTIDGKEEYKLYYKANDGSYIELLEDADGDNIGIAKIKGDSSETEYIYTVQSSGWEKNINNGLVIPGKDTGVITVKNSDGNVKCTIYPTKNASDEYMVGYTHDNCGELKLEGTVWDKNVTSTGHFKLLLSGTYVLREISAPKSYRLNTEEIMVLINEDGVFANAGDADNGITVGNGPGYISSTLDFFASSGMIDETLTWIYTQLEINSAKSFAEFEIAEESESNWSFALPSNKTAAGVTSGITNDRTNAMVTYLTYLEGNSIKSPTGTAAIFNYGPTENGNASGQQQRAPAGKAGITTAHGEGTLRLYTDEGWSKLAIYQDYAYGVEQIINSDYRYTNYEDLTGQNLTNLFSNSTFIRISDDAMIDITLQKVDADDMTKGLNGAKFVLYYLDEDNTKCYYSYSETTGDVTWVKEITGSQEQTEEQLKETEEAQKAQKENLALTTAEKNGVDGLINFVKLHDRTYYIEEISAPEGYMLLNKIIELKIKSAAAELVNKTAGVSIDEGKFDENSDRYDYTVTLANTAKYRLPAMGGASSAVYTVAGSIVLMLTAAAYIWLFVKWRKRGEE